VGKFDGVHMGHQALLAATRAAAQRLGLLTGAVTFDRHPAEVLFPGSAPAYLTPLPVKLRLLEAAGADFCIVLPVDAGTLDWPPDRFVDAVLVEAARAQHVVAGPDFRYGHNREGDADTLRAAGLRCAFSVEQLPPVMVRGRRVSSYAVRRALEAGNLPLAEAMLGRPYSVEGVVTGGKQVGRTLGWPTANVAFDVPAALPALGIYAVTAEFDGAERPAVASLGVRPTLEGEEAPVWLEVYVLDWSGDLYGQRLRVTFRLRLRDEERFPGLPELKVQIARDVEDARAYFTTKGAAGRV
jgi:riboflavin kinase/FMN adenylyltransferase